MAEIFRRIVQMLGGWRALTIRCRTPEKILAKLREEGCALVQAADLGEYTLALTARRAEAALIRELCARYSLEIVSDAPVGFDFWDWCKGAWPFAAGVLAALLAIAPLFSKIWLIDVSCPEGGDAGAIRAALERCGVEEGGDFPDENLLARDLEAICPGFAHISARREGVALRIAAYSETIPPDVYDVAAARDLVAKFDAQVGEIEVLTGRAAVRSGDIVKKGQILILGEEKATDESTRGVRAIGTVQGNVWAQAEAKGSLRIAQERPTGRRRLRAEIVLCDFSLPILHAPDFAMQEISAQEIEIGGIFLPLRLRREILQETEIVYEKADEKALRAALEAHALAKALAKLPENAQIVDKWADYSMMDSEEICVRVCLQATASVAAARR